MLNPGDPTHFILIRGAKEHNLQNLSLHLPKGKLILFTGPSGSGKSSLAFHTLYAEGQRRYLESLSLYARQFLEKMPKPDVDAIEGLLPAISIEQKTLSHNPRSTVGTVTEVYDYLRLLFSRVGTLYSPTTGLPIQAQTRTQMVERVQALPKGKPFLLLAPIVRQEKWTFRRELDELQRSGYSRVKVDGNLYLLEEVPVLKGKNPILSVVVDRLCRDSSAEFQDRLINSLETGLALGKGTVIIEPSDSTGREDHSFVLSAHFLCPKSGFTLDKIEPSLFSFNHPSGACPECEGLGLGNHSSFVVEESSFPCSSCHGDRLRPEALCVRISQQNIAQVTHFSMEELFSWCQQVPQQIAFPLRPIADRILQEILPRVTYLLDVGLSYLSLARPSATLSGGESQRIRLASQVGSGLTGVLYVLDEPSVGLHPRDNDRLLRILLKLKTLGNTVIVVEHDEESICAADHIVDFGPGAGRFGGHICGQGSLQQILETKESPTGAYLRGEKKVPVPCSRRKGSGKILRLIGARIHTLQNLTVEFPLGKFIGVTGVSGSGKSSLVMDTLRQGLEIHHQEVRKTLWLDRIEGLEYTDKVVSIDQSPIGRTPRSNPATYIGAYSPIREWYASLPESRARGYAPGRFSFNVKGGRCEACKGEGILTIAMNFLPDMKVLCKACNGARYSRETLAIRYKERSIADVLKLFLEEAAVFFSEIPSIANPLQTLCSVGLGYLQLGQPATTLSGGEAQRVKLAKELCRRSTGKTVYILDEPTTGLHFQDVQQLLVVLHRLVDQGNTVVVIEHNLEVIKTADWVLDMGPEGGKGGGTLVAVGTPEEIAQTPTSITGRYLAPLLATQLIDVTFT